MLSASTAAQSCVESAEEKLTSLLRSSGLWYWRKKIRAYNQTPAVIKAVETWIAEGKPRPATRFVRRNANKFAKALLAHNKVIYSQWAVRHNETYPCTGGTVRVICTGDTIEFRIQRTDVVTLDANDLHLEQKLQCLRDELAITI